MIEIIFLIVLIAIMIDGILMIFVNFSKHHQYEYKFNPRLVTVVIPVYNGAEHILKTLKATIAVFEEDQIIIVDDGSTDQTQRIIEEAFPSVRLIAYKENKGKTNAIKEGLEYVKTPYVLLLDDDTLIDKDFKCPTSIMGTICSAVAFQVVPKGKGLLTSLQIHEYEKAMRSRRFCNKNKSVFCISGAVGFFQVERLKKILTLHSGIFQAEDLETTLLELKQDGKVIFVNEVAYTFVPTSFRDLAKQRTKSWWVGLYRNTFLLLRLLKSKSCWRFRYTAGYEVFNIITAPLKVLSLGWLIISQAWFLLGILYVIYLFFEICVCLKHQKRGMFLTIIIYPFYGLLQIIFYNIAALFYLNKLFRDKLSRG